MFQEKYISEKEVKIVGLEINHEEKQTEKKKVKFPQAPLSMIEVSY